MGIWASRAPVASPPERNEVSITLGGQQTATIAPRTRFRTFTRHNVSRALYNRGAGVMTFGLSDAGKTAVVTRLVHGNFVEDGLPTIGLEFWIMNFNDNTWIELWDVGRGLTTLPTTYARTSEGIIFVIDATDRDKLHDAAEQFVALKTHLSSRTAILVLANKQDLAGALTPPQIIDELRLDTLEQRWHIQPAAAITGAGVYDGLEWLREAMKANMSS